MKSALAVFAILFAVSSSVSAETNDKEQPPTAQQKQPKKRAAATEAKPKAEQTATPGGMPQSFVIPSNTCEQGTPLQKLLRDKPRESK
jgi:hypothetical protein